MLRTAKNTVAEPRATRQDDAYFDLIRRFPLRPLRTQEDADEAIGLLRELGARADEAGLSSEENDYADILRSLIDNWEQRHPSYLRQLMNKHPVDAVELLKELMQQHKMNTVSLGKLVGGSGHASLILNRKRGLSKANIRKLAAHFHVSPAVFFE